MGSIKSLPSVPPPAKLDPADAERYLQNKQKRQDENYKRLASKIVEAMKPSVSAAMPPPPPIPHRVISGTDLQSMNIPIAPLIFGLLARRESLLILAQSGIGKSLLTNQIALTAGSTMPGLLWGVFPILETLKTYFIQSENSAGAQQNRLNLMVRGNPQLKESLNNLLFPYCEEDIRHSGFLGDHAFQDSIMRDLKSCKADIAVIDPLISFIGTDENDNAGMRKALDGLSRVCDRANVGVVVVHHVNKGMGTRNDVFPGRGASAIGDWAANILVLSTVKDPLGNPTKIIEIRHHKARNYETKPPFYLERTSDLLFQPVANPNTAKNQERLKTVRECLVVLGGQVEIKSQLETAVVQKTGLGRSTVQRAIREAVELGFIEIVPGKTRDGYRIAQSAQNTMGEGENK